MKSPEFEWDDDKSTSNERKHRVSFEEASSAFADGEGLLIGDPDRHPGDRHPGDKHPEEERYVLLSMSSSLRLIVVVHTFRDSDSVIRLISARKATRGEWLQYRHR